MLWKVKAFLSSIHLDLDDWSDEKNLIGRDGRLIAEAQPDGKVFYRYHFLP